MMCHESSSQSWVIDCRNPLIARLSTSFVKTWVFVCRCHLAAFHLRSSAVSCCGRPIFLWALLCPSFCQLWQRLCDSGRLCSTHGWMFGLFFVSFSVGTCHLCVLVVSWHGWPISLWVVVELGLKYSSAVSAAGFVTTGDDIWVTRAWAKWGVNNMNLQKKRSNYNMSPY